MIVQLPDNSNTQSVYFIGDKGKTEILCEENSYIQMTFSIRVFPFGGLDSFKSYTREYKRMSFKGEAFVYLGEILEPYFMIPELLKDVFNFRDFTGLNKVLLSRPMEVDILFEEYEYSTDVKKGEQTIQGLKFLCGTSQVFCNMGKAEGAGRYTFNSVISYPVFVPAAETFFLNSEALEAPSGIPVSFLYRNPDSENSPVYSLQLRDSDSVHLSEKWYIPDGLQSFHIAWLDENLSLQFFEFTGQYQMKDIFTYVASSTMVEGKERARNIEGILGKEITLNTGYIFKSDIKLIESILLSKKSWVSFDNCLNFVSFSALTKELEYDSEQLLFYFNIEIVLNKDYEDHEPGEPEEEYDLILSYFYDGTAVDFSTAFDDAPVLVNWGDGSQNEELTHKYSAEGTYIIKMNFSRLSLLNFQFKNVLGFEKIPFTVDKIDCTGCRMDLAAIKKLFQMVSSVNHSTAEVVFTDIMYSFFSKYVIVSTQQNPVLMDEETITEAQKLIKKFWYVDYTYNRNFSQGADAVPSSRYLTSDTYTKIYPARHALRMTGSKTYFFNDEDVSFTMSAYKGTGVPWAIYDWGCFVYPRVDINENGNWKVKTMVEFPVNADAVIPFNLGILSDGTHTIRGVQQSYPWVISKKIQYDRLTTVTVEFDVITRDSVYVKKDTNNEWAHNDFDIDVPKPFLNFYPFGFISYSGMGTKVGYYPTALFSSALVASELKEKTIFITEEAGSYKFSFKNYTIDLSGIMTSLKSAVFYIAYITPANKIEVSNPVYVDANGKIILNSDFTVNDIPAGSYICPFVNTEIKSGVTHITGNWDIVNFSRLLITKL